jgi:hypothetical protein
LNDLAPIINLHYDLLLVRFAKRQHHVNGLLVPPLALYLPLNFNANKNVDFPRFFVHI